MSAPGRPKSEFRSAQHEGAPVNATLLFDPLAPPAGAWPPGQEVERRYIEGLARAGVAAMVSNVRTQWLALRSGGRLFPVTVNSAEHGDSYVCLPHSAYALYARQELDIVDVGPLKPLLRVAIAAAERLLRALRINRIVHIDNWLLSTNLHGDWRGDDVGALRRVLAERFPSHLIAIRSVDPWSSPALDAALRADGWLMLPSRQIWVTDDLRRDWRPHHSSAEDRRKLRQSGLRIEDLPSLRPGDAERIAELYRLLYVGKYSPLNPIFTPAWIELTHRIGLLRYRVARDAAGVIRCVAGSFVRAGVLTPPVVGYDTARPQSEALYRIACVLFCEQAEQLGARLNGSAGAAHFKRVRGARGVIESTAVSIAHLSPWRRWTLQALAFVLWRLAVPVMRARQL